MSALAVVGALVAVDVDLNQSDESEGYECHDPWHQGYLDQAFSAGTAFVAGLAALRVGRPAGLALPSINPFHRSISLLKRFAFLLWPKEMLNASKRQETKIRLLIF